MNSMHEEREDLLKTLFEQRPDASLPSGLRKRILKKIERHEAIRRRRLQIFEITAFVLTLLLLIFMAGFILYKFDVKLFSWELWKENAIYLQIGIIALLLMIGDQLITSRLSRHHK